MGFIFTAIIVVGTYFGLNFFPSLHHAVAFTAFGNTVSWFGILFVVISGIGAKFCLGK